MLRRLTKRAQHGRHNSRLQGPSQAAIRIGRQARAVARRHLHLLQLLAADRQAAADSPRRLLRQRTATSPRRRPAFGGVYGGVAARVVDLPKNGQAVCGGNVPPKKKMSGSNILPTANIMNMHEKTANLLTRAVSHSCERERTVDDEPAVGDSLHYAASEQF